MLGRIGRVIVDTLLRMPRVNGRAFVLRRGLCGMGNESPKR